MQATATADEVEEIREAASRLLAQADGLGATRTATWAGETLEAMRSAVPGSQLDPPAETILAQISDMQQMLTDLATLRQAATELREAVRQRIDSGLVESEAARQDLSSFAADLEVVIGNVSAFEGVGAGVPMLCRLLGQVKEWLAGAWVPAQ